MARLYEENAVVELNHVSAVRTGNIKAQYALDGVTKVENGMLLVVNDATKKVSLPAANTNAVYLHASEERLYEEHLGRKAFILKAPNLPRMYKLEVGDIFETNAVTSELANPQVLGKKGIPSTNGLIEIVEAATVTADHKTVLDVVEFITLPNGTQGVKFAVSRA